MLKTCSIKRRTSKILCNVSGLYFFQGGILDIEGAVLNIHTPSETNKAIVASLQGFVMQYESEYLGKLLGEKLYEEFSSYIANERKTKEKDGMIL